MLKGVKKPKHLTLFSLFISWDETDEPTCKKNINKAEEGSELALK